jgi:hypothetical protein
MKAPWLALCLLALPVVPALAAKPAAKATPVAGEQGLPLTPAQLQSGMQRFIQEEADCRSVSFEKVRIQKNGAMIRQKLERDGADIDTAMDVSKAGKVANLRLQADTKDPAHLTVMLCATYAAMRSLQPALERPELARQAALELWQQAQQGTVTKTFHGQSFRAQMSPFEVNAF